MPELKETSNHGGLPIPHSKVGPRGFIANMETLDSQELFVSANSGNLTPGFLQSCLLASPISFCLPYCTAAMAIIEHAKNIHVSNQIRPPR